MHKNTLDKLLDTTHGQVIVDGVDVRELDPDLLWGKIGYVPQRLQIDPTLPLTVSRFLSLPMRLPKPAIEEALDQAGAQDPDRSHCTPAASVDAGSESGDGVAVGAWILRDPTGVVPNQAIGVLHDHRGAAIVDLEFMGFDRPAEVIFQAVNFDLPVVEVPVESRYFEDASSVGFRQGVVYGLGTLWTALRYRLHRWGLAPSEKVKR